MLFSNIEIL